MCNVLFILSIDFLPLCRNQSLLMNFCSMNLHLQFIWKFLVVCVSPTLYKNIKQNLIPWLGNIYSLVVRRITKYISYMNYNIIIFLCIRISFSMKPCFISNTDPHLPILIQHNLTHLTKLILKFGIFFHFNIPVPLACLHLIMCTHQLMTYQLLFILSLSIYIDLSPLMCPLVTGLLNIFH